MAEKDYTLADFPVGTPVAVHGNSDVQRGVVTKVGKTRVTVEVPRYNGADGTYTRQFFEQKYGAKERGLPEYGGSQFSSDRLVHAGDPLVAILEHREALRRAQKGAQEACAHFASRRPQDATPEAVVRLQQTLQAFLDETSKLAVANDG